MTTIAITIDWAAIHAACDALDHARTSGPDLCIGYDGIADAFGGSYFGESYESRGLDGLYSIRGALALTTNHAWHIIHRGATDVREAAQRRTEDGYYSALVPVLDEDGEEIIDEDGQVRTQKVRRWSRAVSARTVAHRVQQTIQRIQAAVRTMLAARPLYDLLCKIGVVTAESGSCITAGTGDERLNATGLRWLAGAIRENQPVTLAQAQAFLDGGIAGLRAALASEGRDEVSQDDNHYLQH